MKKITTTPVSLLKPGDVVRGVSPDGKVIKVVSLETDYAPLHLRNRARTYKITWSQGSRRLLGATNVEVAR